MRFYLARFAVEYLILQRIRIVHTTLGQYSANPAMPVQVTAWNPIKQSPHGTPAQPLLTRKATQ